MSNRYLTGTGTRTLQFLHFGYSVSVVFLSLSLSLSLSVYLSVCLSVCLSLSFFSPQCCNIRINVLSQSSIETTYLLSIETKYLSEINVWVWVSRVPKFPRFHIAYETRIYFETSDSRPMSDIFNFRKHQRRNINVFLRARRRPVLGFILMLRVVLRTNVPMFAHVPIQAADNETFESVWVAYCGHIGIVIMCVYMCYSRLALSCVWNHRLRYIHRSRGVDTSLKTSLCARNTITNIITCSYL